LFISIIVSDSSYPLETVLNKKISKFNRTVWLIYARHCTPVSIKIGQDLLKLITKVFWCVFVPHSVDAGHCWLCCPL